MNIVKFIYKYFMFWVWSVLSLLLMSDKCFRHVGALAYEMHKMDKRRLRRIEVYNDGVLPPIYKYRWVERK